MALEDTSVIDLMARPDAAGKVCLIITDAGMTTDPELRFELLTKKLQAYVRAVVGGELEVEYPEKPPTDFFIRVVCAHPPTDAMRQITSVGEFDGQIPVCFETWQREAEADSAAPGVETISPASELLLRPPVPPPLPAAVQPKRSGWFRVVAALLLAGLIVAVGVGIWLVRGQHVPATIAEGVETPGTNDPGTAVSPRSNLVPGDAVNDDLIILSAEFGFGSHQANVKARVAELLRTQPKGFEVSRKALQCDPLPYKQKNLIIRYRYKSADYTVKLSEGRRVSAQTLAARATK